MNSKAEWNNSRIPRIIIETGEKLTEDQESGIGRTSTKEKERERTHTQIRKTTADKRNSSEILLQPSAKRSRVKETVNTTKDSGKGREKVEKQKTKPNKIVRG